MLYHGPLTKGDELEWMAWKTAGSAIDNSEGPGHVDVSGFKSKAGDHHATHTHSHNVSILHVQLPNLLEQLKLLDREASDVEVG